MWYLIVLIPDLCTLTYFAQRHNAMTPVRLESAAPWSQIKHSTTEPLRSTNNLDSADTPLYMHQASAEFKLFEIVMILQIDFLGAKSILKKKKDFFTKFDRVKSSRSNVCIEGSQLIIYKNL